MNAISQPAPMMPNATALLRRLDPPPALIRRDAAPRRTRIWEFATNLHCSIIGTCLSAVELRSTLRKCGVSVNGVSDHDLHKVGVTFAGRQADTARQLHKALDLRHKLAVSQFGRANSEDALRAMWCDAVRSGDIPGAYWATLTHPHASQAIVREAFGEVHMLSHLVGSANRADIKRLCILEAEKAELLDKVNRQQAALHEAVVQRDTQIAGLRQALADRLVAAAPANPDIETLQDLITDRERRLATEIRHRVALEQRLAAVLAERDNERAARTTAETANADLRQELQAAETALAAAPTDDGGNPDLQGTTLLYVGARPNQIAHLRGSVEAWGGELLHHDGGIEHHPTLLAGLVSRCDIAAFPVDCVSHDAVNILKTQCRRAAKRYLPLRSASVTSLLAGLRAAAVPAPDRTVD